MIAEETSVAKSSAGPQNGGVVAPSISLPKGGGAIRGIGEKFAANPVTGTGSMTVPIATSPGRSGFGPQLSLTYDSGANGDGPFGFGWNLSLPSITRKTDKGLPKYRDFEESDVFILSGAEDLVPVYRQDPDGTWVADPVHPGFHRNAGEVWVRDRTDRLVVHEDNRIIDHRTYHVRRYRPRIEGLFARIERWTNVSNASETFWRSISKDNITTWYGKTPESRVADPADASRIFSWLICQSHDDKGNVLVYGYKPEDSARIFEDSAGNSLRKVHERNRTDQTRSAQRYLKRIRYGNNLPYLPELKADAAWPEPLGVDDLDASKNWLFEVVFDYGEHDVDAPKSNESGVWPVRNDPFSTYRAGFENRTYRLCQRVLMFHHFPIEPGVGADCLVRSTDFDYSYEENPTDARNPIYSFVLSVTQTGYKRKSSPETGYLKKSLPPVEFEYTQAIVQDTVHDVDAASLENMPIGIDGANYQWVDLDGEGLSGIFTEQAGGWFYKRNLSPINTVGANGSTQVEALFAPVELVASKPAASLAGHAQFMDLAGDGQPDVVTLDGPVRGFYERTDDPGWETFRSFRSFPNLDTRDPNLKFIDLDGDGHADILITEDDALVWHESLAEEGFGSAQRVHQPFDEEKGPRLVFADGTQSIYLADLSGDGLTDLVRIRNGEVCYYPNLGFCRFGTKVTMDNSPWFDSLDQFDQKRIRLADIDGSGTTDILYLHGDGVRIYFNQSGNSWSKPQLLSIFPRVDNLAAITPTDLLGNGTACLVWSSPLPGNARRQMRYVDLMGGQKPHLLIKSVNNLGAETIVSYASSTKFYLDDKFAGKPWVTKLPFPVHVVEKVETFDWISRNRFVTRYAYHHGYFDGEEREFRGFGMVEQRDTEQFASLSDSDNFPTGDNIDTASHVPPALTKTWFHTGAWPEEEKISQHLAHEYFGAPEESDPDYDKKWNALVVVLLPDTILPQDILLSDGTRQAYSLTNDEQREACRALKGSMLRQEVYALDGTAKEEIPYAVSEQNFTIELLQTRAGNRHAVFFAHPREALSYHYERNPMDPRTSHAVTLDVDAFGNVLRSVAVGYPRANVPERQPEQNETHFTLTLNRVANRDDQVDWLRVGVPVETRTYQVVKPPDGAKRFAWEELNELLTALVPLDQDEPRSSNTVPYEQWDWRNQWNPQTEPGGLVNGQPVNTRLRLIEHIRTLYRRNDLAALSPLGVVESLAVPGEGYKLAFTPGLIASIFKRKRVGGPDETLLPIPAPILEGNGADQGGYVTMDGNSWIPSGRAFFDPNANISTPANTAAQELNTARKNFYLPRKIVDPFGQCTAVNYDGPADPNEPRYDLLVASTVDALSNIVTSVNDYRVLQPALVTDPNGNRSEARFDALGMVAGTAVMGKATEMLGDLLDTSFQPDLTQVQLDAFMAKPREAAENPDESMATQVVYDLLGKATTRIVYDLDRFKRLGEPPFAATIARETHFNAPLPPQGLRIQVSFSYSDGFGREIQKKIQAEPGRVPTRATNGKILIGTDGQPVMTSNDVSPRWVGSGWKVFNNKGKPVRQYEPFFTDTPRFEFDLRIGVSPVLFYDPLERVVATLHPDHTWEKVVFDPWQQSTYDVNDTVLNADGSTDPKSDGDVAEFFSRLPDADYLPTWYEQRSALPAKEPDRIAADKAAVHRQTPTIAHFDTLGRIFLTIAQNRFERNGATIEESYATRVELDIEGNQRAVIDPKDRVVMLYDYDMLGTRIHQASMEAGERWMLNDATGKTIRAWDSRRFIRRMTYDELRRPTALFVTENGVERQAERTVYGESLGNTDNLRARVYQVFDGAGVVTSEAYDFKGNVLQNRRDLLPDYKQTVNWMQNPVANDGSFTTISTYDALNRPLTVETPDHSVYRPIFNEANLLDKVDVNLRGATAPTHFVTNIDCNAKGQRELVAYGNGAKTTYEYDPFTFRLIKLTTTRPAGLTRLSATLFADPAVIQELCYTYDPAGNITRLEDVALKSVFYNREQVDPISDYVYDAIYRLLFAAGREHIGQTSFAPEPQTGNLRDYPTLGLVANPNDLQAMRNYSEQYDYDEVGNFKTMTHVAQSGNWTRTYQCDEISLLEPGKSSNRLSSTQVGNDPSEPYTHDAHGNMSRMPHLPTMEWDFKDQLHATQQQIVNNGAGEKTYYVYDASGQRIRKVVETQNGRRKQERIYLAGFEIYREYNGNGTTVTLERETLHVMDDKQRTALVETQTIENSSFILHPSSLARYQFRNHLGSASMELDDQAQIISYEEYSPYGSSTYQAVRGQTEASKRYRYTGKERDEETGLYYHGARYYAAWTARWITCDPQVAVNLYAYGNENPIKFKDPNGRAPSCEGQPGCQLTLLQSLMIKRKQLSGDPLDLDRAKAIQDQSDQYKQSNYEALLRQTAETDQNAPSLLDRATEQLGEIAGTVVSYVDRASSWLSEKTGYGKAKEAVKEAVRPIGEDLVSRINPSQAGYNSADPLASEIAVSSEAKAREIGGSGAVGVVTATTDILETVALDKGLGKIAETGAVVLSKAAKTALSVVTRTRSGVSFEIKGTAAAFEAVRKLDNFVYRLYNAAGDVIYVGKSNNPIERLAAHLGDKEWFAEIGRLEVVTGKLSDIEAHALEQDLIHQATSGGARLYNKDLSPFETVYPGHEFAPNIPATGEPHNFEVSNK